MAVEKMDRRKALRVLGAAGLGAAALAMTPELAGCGPAGTNPPRPDISHTGETVLDAKAKMRDAITGLPESSIKSLLVARALPYFTATQRFSINRGGLTFPVTDIIVQEHVLPSTPGQDSTHISGTFTDRGHSPHKDQYKVSSPLTVHLPTSVIMPGEAEFVDLNFETTPGRNDIIDGIYPEITLTHPDPSSVSAERQRTNQIVEDFVLVKEAFGLWVDDSMKEKTHNAMVASGIPTTMDVTDSTGKNHRISIVPQVTNALFNNKGRWNAMLDLAAYALALKAFAGTETEKQLRNGVGYPQFIDKLKGVNLGTDSQEVLDNLFKWILTTPEAQGLGHTGDINKIP